MKKIITSNFRVNKLKDFKESFEANSGHTYYMYVSDQTDDIDSLNETERTIFVNQYSNMVFGKRLHSNNIVMMVRNIPYVLNKVYTMYDDTVELPHRDFYTIVKEDEFYHVYKCLDNHNGAPSTVPPQFSYVTSSDNYVFKTLADGYTWKYLTTVPESVVDYFGTDYFFPIIETEEVTKAAIPGAIDIIRVDGEGRGYDNYTAGIFNFSDLRINENELLYRISNNSINHSNGYYTGCMIYLNEGQGVGQYRTVEDYFSNANGNYIVIDSKFDINPTNGTKYEIYPEVLIDGYGTNITRARARAIVDPLMSNSISHVEMLNIGSNYEYAVANVIANNVVGVISESKVRPIYSPQMGHGSDVFGELYSNTLAVATKFQNTEFDTIFSNNEYNVIGLVKNPTFSNVMIETTDTYNSFLLNEKIYAIEPKIVTAGAVVQSNSNIINKEIYKLAGVSLVQGGVSGSFAPGDILIVNPAGGESIEDASLMVTHTELRSVDVNASGSNYTNNDVVWLTSGNGTEAELVVTTDNDGHVTSVVISNPGLYTVNPHLENSLTDTDGDGIGLTVDISMRIYAASIHQQGAYKVVPDNVETNTVVGGGGVGAIFALVFETIEPGFFTNQLEPGQQLYLTNKEGTESQLTFVTDVIDDSHIEISSNGLFSCTESIVHVSNPFSNGVVTFIPNTTHIGVCNVLIPFNTGTILVGDSTGTKAVVNAISRNGVEKDFNTFIQLYKYDISMISGEFTTGEIIYQDDETFGATVYMVQEEGSKNMLYVHEITRSFDVSKNVIGANSGAIASINETFSPELIHGSGQVLFAENIETVERLPDQTEHYKLFFEI